MPDDDSLFASSLKRRFRRVAGKAPARPAAPVEPGEELAPGWKGNELNGPDDAPGPAPTAGARPRQAQRQPANRPEVAAPSDEEPEGEVKTPESVGPRNDGPRNPQQPGNPTRAASTPERTVDAWDPSQEEAANPAEAPGAKKPVFGEVQSSLAEIFARKTVTNPLVKALLERHEAVDARELTKELDQFARSIGARKDDQ